MLQEQISQSQRVERYAIDALVNGQWREIAAGRVIGHKRIVVLEKTAAQAIRIRKGTTGIENSELNVENSAVIYDLLGRRVEKMEKGIYIVNGKKIIK